MSRPATTHADRERIRAACGARLDPGSPFLDPDGSWFKALFPDASAHLVAIPGLGDLLVGLRRSRWRSP